MFYVIVQRKCSFFRKNWVASQRNVRKTVFYANDVNSIRSRNFTKSVGIKIRFDQFPTKYFRSFSKLHVEYNQTKLSASLSSIVCHLTFFLHSCHIHVSKSWKTVCWTTTPLRTPMWKLRQICANNEIKGGRVERVW